MFLCTILGSYISGVQGCDVTVEAAVFILMSSLHPLSGPGRVLSNSLGSFHVLVTPSSLSLMNLTLEAFNLLHVFVQKYLLLAIFI